MGEHNAWVRDATTDDLDRLAELGVEIQTLHADNRPDLFRPADRGAFRTFFQRQMEAGALFLVAGSGDEEAEGYTLAEVLERPQTPFQLPRKSVYVHHIAVARSARRGGLGELLLAEIAARASRVGATSVRLDSWAFNIDAHQFFEAQGFVPAQIVFERAAE